MSKYEVINQYNRENYFKVGLRIPKEKKQVLQDLAKANNISINKLIVDAIEKTYGVDLSKDSE
jgi:predicted HicB family RNase H-like nuclease